MYVHMQVDMQVTVQVTCSVEACSREGRMTGREAKLPDTSLQVEEVDTPSITTASTSYLSVPSGCQHLLATLVMSGRLT